MTKIWCAICNEADFGAFPPTKQNVLDHIRFAHGLTINVHTFDGRDLWSLAQNLKWEKRRKELRQLLDHYRKTTRSKGDKSKEELDEDILADLQQKWKRHMEVFDDGAIEGDSAGNGQLIALKAGGVGYGTIAQRSSQIATTVEKTSSAGEYQQVIVSPAAHGAGWYRMAESNFKPVGRRECEEWRYGQSQGANNHESTGHIDQNDAAAVMEDAASALILMSKSQQSIVEDPQAESGQETEPEQDAVDISITIDSDAEIEGEPVSLSTGGDIPGNSEAIRDPEAI